MVTGTHSNLLSSEACKLWSKMEEIGAFLLTPHWISTKDNLGADFLSRQKITAWELDLNQIIFEQIIAHFGVMPTLDTFASRQTHKLGRYMSWEADPQAVGRDALLCKWDNLNWIFPPVPLIPKILLKLKQERVDALLVCPYWPTSMWFLLVQEMLLAPPLSLPPFRMILMKVTNMETHQLTENTGMIKIDKEAIEKVLIHQQEEFNRKLELGTIINNFMEKNEFNITKNG